MKKTSKHNYRRLSNKVKKLDLQNATNAQLEQLFNKQHIKYVMSLEDQLQEDKAHLLLKQETPSISAYHTDFDNKKMTTAIFYLNTNNGSTEFKNGDVINCMRNRLIMFPTNTSHRAIGQTDEPTRIVFNFNFIKGENVTI